MGQARRRGTRKERVAAAKPKLKYFIKNFMTIKRRAPMSKEGSIAEISQKEETKNDK